jgi:hypothetical protein
MTTTELADITDHILTEIRAMLDHRARQHRHRAVTITTTAATIWALAAFTRRVHQVPTWRTDNN